jgi:hypothetical protein
MKDLPDRNDPIYKEIASFKGYELRDSIAVELALRNQNVIKLLNDLHESIVTLSLIEKSKPYDYEGYLKHNNIYNSILKDLENNYFVDGVKIVARNRDDIDAAILVRFFDDLVVYKNSVTVNDQTHDNSILDELSRWFDEQNEENYIVNEDDQISENSILDESAPSLDDSMSEIDRYQKYASIFHDSFEKNETASKNEPIVEDDRKGNLVYKYKYDSLHNLIIKPSYFLKNNHKIHIRTVPKFSRFPLIVPAHLNKMIGINLNVSLPKNELLAQMKAIIENIYKLKSIEMPYEMYIDDLFTYTDKNSPIKKHGEELADLFFMYDYYAARKNKYLNESEREMYEYIDMAFIDFYDLPKEDMRAQTNTYYKGDWYKTNKIKMIRLIEKSEYKNLITGIKNLDEVTAYKEFDTSELKTLDELT